MHTQEEPHSSIQVVPITRPSLRDGRTAYAVISREPNFPFGLPRRSNWMMPSTRSGSRASSNDLTVATTARTTRFCRTRVRWSPHYLPALSTLPEECGETNFTAPSSARSLGLTGTTRPARTSHADAAASTASPARDQDDLEIAPLGEPGWP